MSIDRRAIAARWPGQITCKGDTIAVSINGVLLATVHDQTLQSGYVQLAAGFGTAGLNDIAGPVNVRLANLIVTQA